MFYYVPLISFTGLINKFFSWRGFVPLSRLTYCVYLIHPVVVIADLMAYRVFAYFTISYVVSRFCLKVSLNNVLLNNIFNQLNETIMNRKSCQLVESVKTYRTYSSIELFGKDTLMDC